MADDGQSKTKQYALLALILTFLGGSGGLYLIQRLWPENKPPQAVIEVFPADGAAPLNAVLVGAGSKDPDGDQLSYTWSVDSNQIPQTNGTVQYTFAVAKPYVVTLKVEDRSGLADSSTKTVEVRVPFDLASFIEKEDSIRVQIEKGEYFTALDLANFYRHNCGSAPPDRCAKVHALAAEAQRFLYRFEEGLISINKAKALDEGNVLHKIDIAQFQILLGDSQKAISLLQSVVDESPSSMRAAFFLALAKALEGEYAAAMTKLDRIADVGGQHQMAARLGAVILSRLAGGSLGEISSEDIRTAVCSDRALRSIVIEDTIFSEPHLYCYRELLKRLNESDRIELKSAVESSPCI